MKFAVSNIAWPAAQDETVASVLRQCGVTGIEIAPTKLFPQPLEATAAEIDARREWWSQRGFHIAAAQALLFGRPDLLLFDTLALRIETLDYLRGIIALCSRLGAESLVFGSPKNRRRGALPLADALPIAQQFFAELAVEAERHGVAVVLEANPSEYGADFLTRAADAIEMVRAVDRAGVRLHLDTACMALASDPIGATFDAGFAHLRHFHVSAPNLAAPDRTDGVDHAAFAAELKRRGYAHWISLEMREAVPFDCNRFADSVRWQVRTYG